MLRTIYGDGLNVDILFGGDYIVQFFHEKGSIADTEDVHQNKYDFFLFVVYSQLVKYQQESEFLPDRNAGVDTQYEIDKYDPLVPTCFCNIHKTLVYSQAIWGTLWSFGDTITS